MRSFIQKIFKPSKQRKVVPPIPFSGYRDGACVVKYLDYLSDGDIEELNAMLSWKAFVADSNGRRFGNLAWSGKRVTPQLIPDPRHKLLNDRISLKDKKVLEIGCFEGIHTVSLCSLANEVVAIDSRMENVVKTMVRCGFFGAKPTIFKCDVETWDAPQHWLEADVCHHIGVLYHLADPVAHLTKLSSLIKEAIFLDTHVAIESDSLENFHSNGVEYRYKRYLEHGKKDVFSGMYDHAKWLLLADLKKVLIQCGFKNIELLEERQERNGPRILLLASK